MKIIKKLYNGLDKVIKAIVLFISFAMIFAAFCQILSRELFPQTWSWTDEVSRYCMVWLTYLAAGLGVRYKSHVRIDTLWQALPEKGKTILDFLANICTLAFGAFIAWQGIIISGKNMQQHTASLHFPMGLVYLAVPIGGIVMILFSIESFINLFNKTADNKEED